MPEGKEGLGRRDFLKIFGFGVAAASGAAVVDYLANNRNNLNNPENFREFVGKEIYPAYFKGRVYVREGASIHKEPTFWSEEEDRSLITTQKNPNTQIAEVKMGDEFAVRDPLLVFQEAGEGEGGVFVKQIETPEGKKINIDTRGSWIVFGLGLTENAPDYVRDDIKRTTHNVGCVNFQDLAFEPEGERVQFSFPQKAIEYRQEIDLGL